ncbi:hypothetical protein LVJ94_26225 [Pendulispora rubella]|uniref:SMI1/KNR4 family protein n=1 Tax=Pendulispora rubella TaxID=2741070 RepID=A0ABZ2KPE1_9BACT
MDRVTGGAAGKASRLVTADEMKKITKQKPLRHELPLDRAALERLPWGPAFRALVEGPVEAIVPTLCARCTRGESEAVAAFATMLLEDMSPVAVVEGVAAVRAVPPKEPKGKELFEIVMGAWLELRPADAEEPEEGDPSLLLGEPPTRDEVEASFASAGIPTQPAMVEFFTTFGRLRDMPPMHSGHFTVPSARDRFDAEDSDDDDGSRQAWDGAAIIYSAQNGDEILLNAKGEIAWAVLETGQVRTIGPFEKLLGAYPVDSYSWPD